jgi:hypothetical protein
MIRFPDMRCGFKETNFCLDSRKLIRAERQSEVISSKFIVEMNTLKFDRK